MATYQSDKVSLLTSAETVFDKVSDLEGLSELIKKAPTDKVPEEQRQMLDQIAVTPETISFPAGPAGMITLRKAREVRPTLVELHGEGTPVPVALKLMITPLTPDTCEAQVVFEIQIPAMLKPMVNGPLQKMCDQFSNMLRQIPFAQA